MEKQNPVKYLIIGGGVAGTSAAETIRQNDASGAITIISDEPYRFYSRLMLSKPNFFLEKIPFDSIWLKKDTWYQENKIQLVKGQKAAALDAAARLVVLDSGEKLPYDKLLLALGATPYIWQVKGANLPGVCFLRTLDDSKKIIAEVKTAKNAVCIGGGFTSFEMCEMLAAAGIKVTLLIRENYFWEPLLDKASGQMIENVLEKNGITIIRGQETEEVLGKDHVTEIKLKNGTVIPCDMIVAGIGVYPPTALAKNAGINTNRGIIANEFLETSKPDIWTAGDCAEFKDLILDEQVILGNWVNAQSQGRIAGNNMTGGKKPFRMVSFYTAQGMGMTIGFAGDVRPLADRKIIERGSREINSYARILTHNGHIVGATLINRTPELSSLTNLIESKLDITSHLFALSDPSFDLKQILTEARAVKTSDKKIKIGWFTFSCCEDNTVVMTEVMNDHWQEWKKIFDFRHARVLKSKNILDELDIAFIEGAIASPEQETKVKEIRTKSKKLVAVGACAVQGMPSGQRNLFNDDQKHRIAFLVERFKALEKVRKVADVVKVDETIPGCPMSPDDFLKTVDKLVKELAAN